MDDRRLLRFGILGTALAALFCATPVLVALLAVVGLSSAVGWLDYVLLPAFAIFLAITIYALIHKRRGSASGAATGKAPQGRG